MTDDSTALEEFLDRDFEYTSGVSLEAGKVAPAARGQILNLSFKHPGKPEGISAYKAAGALAERLKKDFSDVCYDGYGLTPTYDKLKGAGNIHGTVKMKVYFLPVGYYNNTTQEAGTSPPEVVDNFMRDLAAYKEKNAQQAGETRDDALPADSKGLIEALYSGAIIESRGMGIS